MCANQELTKREIFRQLGLTNQTNNVRTNIEPLIRNGLLGMVISRRSSKYQKYKTTESGLAFLKYLRRGSKR